MKARREDCSTRRTIVFRPIKISGLSVKATLRWMRNVPGSFWDFPAPRFWPLNGQEHTLVRPTGSTFVECSLRSKASSVHFPFSQCSEVLASTDHPIRFSPVVGAKCRPPKSKITVSLSENTQMITHPNTKNKHGANSKH